MNFYLCCQSSSELIHIGNKTREFQWHHYFWDWYCKKVIPNELKSLSNLTFSQMFLAVWFVFVYIRFSWDNSWLHQKKSLSCFCGKKVNFQLIGMTFLQYQFSKEWCHWSSPVFLSMQISGDKFWWHRWTIYPKFYLYGSRCSERVVVRSTGIKMWWFFWQYTH